MAEGKGLCSLGASHLQISEKRLLEAVGGDPEVLRAIHAHYSMRVQDLVSSQGSPAFFWLLLLLLLLLRMEGPAPRSFMELTSGAM